MEKKQVITEKEYTYILKAVAILSVVSAHCAGITNENSFTHEIFSKILTYIGTMGVPVFFVISGYLFSKNTKTFKEFWKRKIHILLLPWVFCETLLWFYIVLRKGGISFSGWLQFLLGYQHTTYYLTVLVVFYFLFWFLKKDWQLYLVGIISIMSMISTGWGLPLDFLNDVCGTYYLNPLNWAVFFATGVLLSRKTTLLEVASKNSKGLGIWFILSCTYFILCWMGDLELAYFSEFAIFSHVVNIMLCISAAYLIGCSGLAGGMIIVGQDSFTIYLTHQFIVGALVVVTNLLGFSFLVIVRPVITIIVIMLGLWIYKKIEQKCNGKINFVSKMIGLR